VHTIAEDGEGSELFRTSKLFSLSFNMLRERKISRASSKQHIGSANAPPSYADPYKKICDYFVPGKTVQMVSSLKHKCATVALLPRVASARRSSPLSSSAMRASRALFCATNSSTRAVSPQSPLISCGSVAAAPAPAGSRRQQANRSSPAACELETARLENLNALDPSHTAAEE
jgi:hypothetical protein